jgi:hypothetical protein
VHPRTPKYTLERNRAQVLPRPAYHECRNPQRFDVKSLTRYFLTISLSSEPLLNKNYPDVKVPAHPYLSR